MARPHAWARSVASLCADEKCSVKYVVVNKAGNVQLSTVLNVKVVADAVKTKCVTHSAEQTREELTEKVTSVCCLSFKLQRRSWCFIQTLKRAKRGCC